MSVSWERFSGCFLGQCLGDALGHPVEGFPTHECQDYLHRLVRPLWYRDHAPQEEYIGQYTDDSQMARELLASLNTHPEFDPEDYIARLRPLFEQGLAVVPGLACIDAMTAIGAGVPWEQAGCPPPRAGNGTAMRAAPVGMLYHDDPEKLIRIARRQGWITHRDPRCDAGSVAIAGAVALALTDRIEPEPFCTQLADWMTEAEPTFAELVRQLPEHIGLPTEQALEIIAPAGLTPGYHQTWPGISPFVVPTVLWSLYCFLHTPDDYYESIWLSIAVGGDVDTTAAITGAVSGAYNGRSVLPEHLLNKLHDHREWRLAELDQLCREAFESLNRS